jgi:hypothetical protein
VLEARVSRNDINPPALTSATLSWTDLNNDQIPQGEPGCTYQTAGCEINLAQLPNSVPSTGTVASLSVPLLPRQTEFGDRFAPARSQYCENHQGWPRKRAAENSTSSTR